MAAGVVVVDSRHGQRQHVAPGINRGRFFGGAMRDAAAVVPVIERIDHAFWTPLFLAWLLALLATAAALFLGEIMGKTPCVLCWYQRIAMFPLVLLLGTGLLASDSRSVHYALPLVGVGWSVAAYHLLVFWGFVSEGLVPCGKGGACADTDLQVVGSVPIPLLSLLAFSGILILLWLAKIRAKV